MPIDKVKIRARIEVGRFNVETPYILSFNVNRTRGQVSTFDARLKIADGEIADMTGGPVKIYAGTDYPRNRIFTGIVKKATISPCFDDPHFVLVNISGADALSLLQNKKYTRRCRGTATSWATIDSVSRKGLKSGKFKVRQQPVLMVTDSELKDNPQVTTSATTSKRFSEVGRLAPQTDDAGATVTAEILAEGDNRTSPDGG